MNETKPTTTPKADVSRRNGAASHGPKTEEGKQRSSRNAVSHGLFSSVKTILATDDAKEFEEFHRNYYEDLAPTTASEIVLAEKIIACAWRLARIYDIEAKLLQVKLRDAGDVDSKYLLNQHAIEGLHRLERGLERTARSAHQELKELKQSAIGETRRNEPGEIQDLQNRTQEFDPEPANAAVERMIAEKMADPDRQVYDSERHRSMIRNPESYIKVSLTGMWPHYSHMPEEMLRDALEKAVRDPKSGLGKMLAKTKEKHPQFAEQPLENLLVALFNDKTLLTEYERLD